MSYIGSIDYAGLLSERNDNARVNPQEPLKTHHHHMAQLQSQQVDEKRNTIMETMEPDDARIKDESSQKHSGSDHKRHKQDDTEEDKETKYIYPVDEDLGQKFDFSA